MPKPKELKYIDNSVSFDDVETVFDYNKSALLHFEQELLIQEFDGIVESLKHAEIMQSNNE